MKKKFNASLESLSPRHFNERKKNSEVWVEKLSYWQYLMVMIRLILMVKDSFSIHWTFRAPDPRNIEKY